MPPGGWTLMCGSQQGSLDEEGLQPCCRGSCLTHRTLLNSGYCLASLWPYLFPTFFGNTPVLINSHPSPDQFTPHGQ